MWHDFTRISAQRRISVQAETGISEKPVSKFFKGIQINRKYFIRICKALDLDPDELSSPEPIIEIPRPPVFYYAGKSRINQFDDLEEVLKGNRIVSISEMSGHGKTEFVLKYISDRVDCSNAQFTGGAKFIDLHKDICEQIEGFFLNIASANPNVDDWDICPHKDEKKKVQWYYKEYERRCLDKPFPILLVLDDVERSDQIEGFLPLDHSEVFKVLITTRKRNICQQYKSFDLKSFAKEDSIDLFRRFINQDWIVDRYQEQLNRLAFLVGYLPLAVELESGLIKTRFIRSDCRDTPEVTTAITKNLDNLIIALEEPQEIPTFLTKIDSGFGLTTNLNESPDRRRQLAENGIVALFNVTWELLTDTSKVISYSCCVFQKTTFDIGTLVSWYSSDEQDDIENCIYANIYEYSFCKINYSDELIFHSIMKRFVINKVRGAEAIKAIENNITLCLVRDMMTDQALENSKSHWSHPNYRKLAEIFNERIFQTDPWTHLPRLESHVETLLMQADAAYMSKSKVKQRVEERERKILTRLSTYENNEKKVEELIGLSILYSGNRQYEKCTNVLYEAVDIVCSWDYKDNELLVFIYSELAIAYFDYGMIVPHNMGSILYSTADINSDSLLASLAVSDKVISCAYKAAMPEHNEFFISTYTRVANIYWLFNRGFKAEKYAYKAYCLAKYLEFIEFQGEIVNTIDILARIYLKTDRFGAARKLFLDYIRSRREDILKAEGFDVISMAFLEAGVQQENRKYLLLSRRYAKWACHFYKQIVGEDHAKYISTLRLLDKINIQLGGLDSV